MKINEDYDSNFFSGIKPTSTKSAEIIVPLIIDLLGPHSVIDIGCGIGTWLSVFKANNINDITGVDGDWVKQESLLIPKSCFVARDLIQGFNAERRFDVALCLEVAEHLDPRYARRFVGTLVKLSSIVLFSAAIPFQEGTHHVNEEWPDYWAKLFSEHEYVPVDCIREKIWNNEDVAWWYAQNILVFADKRQVLQNTKLEKAFERTRVSQLSIVHPRKYLVTNVNRLTLKQALSLLPGLMFKSVRAKLQFVRTLAAKTYLSFSTQKNEA